MRDLNVMGAIDEEYCRIFYFLGVFTLFFAILGIVMLVYHAISSPSKVSFIQIVLGLSNIAVYFVVYLENRILYNMCKKIL